MTDGGLITQQTYLESATETLERKQPIWRRHLSQAVDDPARETFRTIVLPALLDVGQPHETSFPVIHDVEQGAHGGHKGLRESIDMLLMV